MCAEDIDTRIGKRLAAVYGCPEKEQETISKVGRCVDRFRGAIDDAELSAALEWWEGDLPYKRQEYPKLRSALADLARHLRKKATPRRLRAIVQWASDHPGQVAAAVGLILAAILRVSYAQFYGRLGVRPEEVGLGSAELLVASLPGTVLVLVLITAAATVVSMPKIALDDAQKARVEDEGRGQQAASHVALFLVLVCVDLILMYQVLVNGFLLDRIPVPESMSGGALGAMIGAISGAIGFLLGASTFGSLVLAFRVRHRGLRPYVVFGGQSFKDGIIASAPTFSLLFLLFVLPLIAADRADRVRGGQEVAEVSFIGFPVLSLRAERSRLLGGASKLGSQGCVLYLGGDGKTAIFYRRLTKDGGDAVIRVPASDLVLASAVASSDSPCLARALKGPKSTRTK
jgi:hypothetical protein